MYQCRVVQRLWSLIDRTRGHKDYRPESLTKGDVTTDGPVHEYGWEDHITMCTTDGWRRPETGPCRRLHV